MSERRRCENCGAFLENDEKVCYVCGEVQLPETAAAPERSSEPRESAIAFEKDADYVMPTESNEIGREPFEDRVPYGDEDLAEPYYEGDKRHIKAQKKRGKKALVITIICVLAAAIIGAVCFCLFNGVFVTEEKPDNKLTIYFDKPNSDIELIKSDGTVYNWTGDVEVSYETNDKAKTKICTPCNDHESLWKVTLPTTAKSVYFYEKDEKSVRTQVTPGFDDEMVYYVSQETFNSQNQLPLGQCERESFKGIGINYAITAQSSESETQETEESEQETTEEQEAPTEEDDSRKTEDKGYYTISLPKSWQSGVTAVENGNCTTYYEDYNYNSYSMGKLASIYVFDANDSAADNLVGVKDIRYNSDQTKKIVITTPTDIQFNEADEEAQRSYLEKNKDLNSFLDSISVQ